MPMPDFSQETPVETIAAGRRPPAPSNRRLGRARPADLSAVFASSADVDSSEVSVAEHARHALLTSTAKASRPSTPIEIASLARQRRSAGRRRHDACAIVHRSSRTALEDLPPVAELVARRARSGDAAHRRSATAPVGEEFTGPGAVEGQASAEVLAQTLVPLMLARRRAGRRQPAVRAGGRASRRRS